MLGLSMLARFLILEVEAPCYRHPGSLVVSGHDMRCDKYSGAADTSRKSNNTEDGIQ